MADIKKKGSVDKPKVKTSAFVPKEAASIIKEKYQEQQERNAPGQKNPVRYATDKVESGGKRAARTAGDALKQKTKKEFIKQRAESTHSSTINRARESTQAPDQRGTTSQGRNASQERQKTQGKQKTQKDAQKSKERRAQLQRFNTRDQSYLAESGQQKSSPGSNHSTAHIGKEEVNSATKPLQSGSQTLQGRRSSTVLNARSAKEGNSGILGTKSCGKAARSIKAEGNRPKLGTLLQKRKNSIKSGKVIQKQVLPAQRAKALAQKKAQQAMVKKAANQTKAATAKAGRLTMRFAMAIGRAAAAAVHGLLAAGGGIILLIAMLCLMLVAAIAASPFGIFLAGGGSEGGVPVSVAVAQVNYAYNETLEELQSGGTYDDVVLKGAGSDWVAVLAVFAVKVAGSNDVDATDVVTLDENRIDRLKAVFWDMTTIFHEVEEIDHPESSEGADDGYTERVLHITITGKIAEEMAAEYGFTDQQLDMLQELLEEREMLEDLIGSLMDVTADAKDVLLNLPEDLSPEREAVIRAACSLVGKVNYFWGGKSLVLGWDSRWGRLTEVTAAGNSTTGTYRPYGLDCSGFVDWVFYNATDGEYIIGHGGGAMAQHSYCTSISWAEAQIGDLVFYPEDTHVGIVCGWDESGNILILHCASGYNNVVITGQEGFTSIGRPVFYGGT